VGVWQLQLTFAVREMYPISGGEVLVGEGERELTNHKRISCKSFHVSLLAYQAATVNIAVQQPSGLTLGHDQLPKHGPKKCLSWL